MENEKGEKEICEGWYLFDDSNVTAVPNTQITNKFGGTSECAYMLLYRKKIWKSKKWKFL